MSINMKKRLVCILTVILTLSMLTSCTIIGKILPGGSDEPQTFEVVSDGGTYSVTAPKNWSVLKDELVEGAPMELGNKVKEQYLVVIRESKEDLEMTFEEYIDTVKEVTKQGAENMEIGEATEETIDGKKAVCLPATGTVDKLNVQYWIYAVDHDDAYIRILTWTLKSKAEESRQIMRDAALSFHIEKQKSEI